MIVEDGDEWQKEGPLETVPNKQNKDPSANYEVQRWGIVIDHEHAYKAFDPLPSAPSNL